MNESPSPSTSPTTLPTQQQTNNTTAVKNNGKNNGYRNSGPKGKGGAIGDIAGLDPFVTAEENKTLRLGLSYKKVRNRVRAKVITTVKTGQSDVRKIFEGISDAEIAVKDPTVPMSFDGPEKPKTSDKIRYQEQVKQVSARRDIFNDNLSLTWDIIWAQCSLNMRNLIVVDDGFDSALEKVNVDWLLQAIQRHMITFMSTSYIASSVVNGERELLSCFQGQKSLGEFRERFMETVEVVTFNNGNIAISKALRMPKSVKVRARTRRNS